MIPRHLTISGEPGPLRSDASSIITDAHSQALQSGLPARFMHAKWTLIYSTTRHGISLQTLYRRAAGCSPSLLIISDTGGVANALSLAMHCDLSAPRTNINSMLM